ncbi:serine/threonine protein kinase [Helicocarpus griseus UAMH5409]|uniref:Serine/threonine protein kinase n=1 Tax=Helicocarpus griseus UAMH5409 TaxID=1447875 RepID=A0A2B7X9Z3_9EURO|nr:serine/threonine protein kinase [Helicocarpus griseus UAMH5409]
MTYSAFPLHIGQILSGKRCQYKLTDHLPSGWGVNNVFKAEILGETSGRALKWATIKTASPRMQATLKNELDEYLKPNVSSCQHIRPLLDIITTSGDEAIPENISKASATPHHFLPSQTRKKDLVLSEAILTGILRALVLFEFNGRVHTDLKAGNILINCPKPAMYEVMLGDLGSAMDNGFDDEPLGPPGLCAPEVFEGKGYYHGSDIWALGMTLLRQFNQNSFVYKLPPGSHYPETIMIAQLMRLYPNWVPQPVEGKICMDMPLQEIFAKASDVKLLLPIAPLEQQLEDMNAPKELKDMLRLLLSLELQKRSSASMILQSKEYIALKKAAKQYMTYV